MSSTEFQSIIQNAPKGEPPSYTTIAPYAPPDTYPPVDSGPFMGTTYAMGVPQGMEHLLQINQLSIREKFKVTQGWGRNFDVLNPVGQGVLQAEQRIHCCGPMFDVTVRDMRGNDVMALHEGCHCCSREMEVHSPDGGLLGFVTLHWNSFVTHLSIKNPAKQVLLLILGPSLQANVFGNISFEVKSSDEQHVVGMIRHTNEEVTVSFPLDMEVTVKAILAGSAFYMDSLIYQRRTELLRRRNSN
ncbi:phospholipid scramblase 3-like isoform X1 [Xenopus tropicalis]|uniref:Phospholipid scramblase n=1 Tax=Xenopus tropicalis TaxID=8364 RepID=A0A8J1JC76_XENTR|nr:phospholipid scramblase 3-like isoform X1 [Xenopus tropicalis]